MKSPASDFETLLLLLVVVFVNGVLAVPPCKREDLYGFEVVGYYHSSRYPFYRGKPGHLPLNISALDDQKHGLYQLNQRIYVSYDGFVYYLQNSYEDGRFSGRYLLTTTNAVDELENIRIPLELTDVKNSYFKDGKIFFKDATWTASSKKWSGPSRDYEEGVTFDIATGRKYRNGAISVVKGVEVHREDCSNEFRAFSEKTASCYNMVKDSTTCRFAVSSDTRDVILFPDKSIERQSCLQSDDRGLLFFEVLGGKCIHHYECSNYILFVKDGDHEWAMQKFRKSHRGEPSNSPCQLDAIRQSQAKFGYVNESKAVVLVKEASKPGIKCHIADLPEPGKSMTLPEGNEIPMGWPTGDLFRSGENFFFWTSGSYWNLKIVNGICKVDIKKPPQLTKILIDKQQEIFNGFTQKGDSASIIGPSAFLWRGEKNVTLVHSLKTNSKSFAQFSSLAAFYVGPWKLRSGNKFITISPDGSTNVRILPTPEVPTEASREARSPSLMVILLVVTLIFTATLFVAFFFCWKFQFVRILSMDLMKILEELEEDEMKSQTLGSSKPKSKEEATGTFPSTRTKSEEDRSSPDAV